jgi:hypothetical protein
MTIGGYIWLTGGPEPSTPQPGEGQEPPPAVKEPDDGSTEAQEDEEKQE